MKRCFDLSLSIFILIAVTPLMLLIALMIKLSSPDSVFYWSERVGYNNKTFRMPKFRSMVSSAPVLPSNDISSPDLYLTPLGILLRRTSLDELPQLFCVIAGKMSLVGPRPVLPCENELLRCRTILGVHLLRPGITGWAQINGRDNLSATEKAKYDYAYLQKQSIFFDLKIILLTFLKVIKQHDIRH